VGEERDRSDWREHHIATLVLALVRALKDPALAWDVGAEAMASAALAWGTFPGGSRMAWVLGYGGRVLEEARTSGRVPAQARARNGARAVKTLSAGEQATLRALASEPLGLDSDAAAVVDQLAREGPPPHVLLEIALSSLTIRGMAAPVPQDHTDG
jgi:hypothetical protein